MRLLELYSGTGSIGPAFERIGWDVVSLDIEAKFEPTHVVNIHDWDYKQYLLTISNLYGRRPSASTSRDAAARAARATLQEHAPTSRARLKSCTTLEPQWRWKIHEQDCLSDRPS